MGSKGSLVISWLLPLCMLVCMPLCSSAMQASEDTHVSYRWNADSTVTFTYRDSVACRVSVRGNCMLPHEDLSFAGRQACRKMHRVSPGVWECTTPRPLSPGLYTYRIIVNGHQKTDPLNPDSVWVRNQRRSVLLVPGDAQTALYKPCAERGKVETVRFAGITGNTFRMMVYLPPHYQDTVLYPVVYLLHGINGDERNWMEQGRVGNILDNLIAGGDIRPVIVVMPRCLLSQPRHDDHVQATNVFNYAEILRGGFERQFYEIENYVATHYSVQSQGNAIAGLSCGARQAANIANRDTLRYDYVGMFSPVVTKKQLPQARGAHYWVGGGSNDWMFLADARSYARDLERLGIAHRYIELQGGHTFNNWRVFVTDFLRWAYPNENKTAALKKQGPHFVLKEQGPLRLWNQEQRQKCIRLMWQTKHISLLSIVLAPYSKKWQTKHISLLSIVLAPYSKKWQTKHISLSSIVLAPCSQKIVHKQNSK